MPDRPKRPSRYRQPKREAVDEVGRSAPAGRRETDRGRGQIPRRRRPESEISRQPRSRGPSGAKKPVRRPASASRSTQRAACTSTLRLELDGVLKSWAVTRGPSLVPGSEAVHTEHYPLEYCTSEGVIPKGDKRRRHHDRVGSGTLDAAGGFRKRLCKGASRFRARRAAPEGALASRENALHASARKRSNGFSSRGTTVSPDWGHRRSERRAIPTLVR